MSHSLAERADAVLRTADATEKAVAARDLAAWWRARRAAATPAEAAASIGAAQPPDAPARPDRPELIEPKRMPKRGPGTPEGRIALLHAVAHIELNAIDLHLDAVARFAPERLPIGYFDDWIAAADDEARHFQLLSERLAAHGSA